MKLSTRTRSLRSESSEGGRERTKPCQSAFRRLSDFYQWLIIRRTEDETQEMIMVRYTYRMIVASTQLTAFATTTMSTLTALLTRHSPFLLLQSSASRSSLPILRWLLRSRPTQDHLVLISVLYPPSSLLPSTFERATDARSVSILDWTECVPEYSAKAPSFDMRLAEACDAIAKCM